ncbi:MAG: hypothetical protein UX94_C0003G0030 [Parcubacteria group bacterium GW2011_GWA2_47_21]|nr:MAG: hypothetical protein UX94_C0003G0030 [Parcubacteria group bacterium GW2011_GWA2_47_21]
MQQTLKKILILALIVSVLAPGFYFALDEVIAPKRAEAQGTSCMGIVVGAILGILGFVGGLLAVPANDAGNLAQNTLTSGATAGSFMKDCILKPLLDRLIRKLIQEFTVSVIDWINGGFDGSPKFVSDPAGFFRNVGDSVAGATIQQFAPWLCGPIAPFVLPALAFRYSNHYFYKQEIGCRLSDIEANIDRFIRGSNPRDFSWSRWAQVTTIPQNNAFGSYLSASLIIDERIAKQLKIKQDDLSFGRGYLSYQKCTESNYELESEEQFYAKLEKTEVLKDVDPDSEEGYYARIENRLKCKTVTPGSTIQDSLSKALGSDLDRYGVADSIDAILGALMDQAIGFVFKGLFSAGDNYESSSNQWKNNLLAYRNKTDYEAGRGAQNTLTNFRQGGQTGASEFDANNNQNAQIIGNYYQNQQDQAMQPSKTIQLFGGLASQNGTLNQYTPAGNAIDGSDVTLAASTGPWQVIFPENKSEYVASVFVKQYTGNISDGNCSDSSIKRVELLKDNTVVDFYSPPSMNAENISTSWTPPKLGDGLRVIADGPKLCIADVKIYRYLKPVVKVDPFFITIKSGDGFSPLQGITVQNVNGDEPVTTCSNQGCAGSITYEIKDNTGVTMPNDFDFAMPGTYIITYSTTDNTVNPVLKSNEVKRTVTVQTAAPLPDPEGPGGAPF